MSKKSRKPAANHPWKAWLPGSMKKSQIPEKMDFPTGILKKNRAR